MKNIYDRTIEIKVEGVSKDWQDTSLWHHDVVLTEEEMTEQSGSCCFATFEDCYNYIKTTKVPNARVSETFFRNRPQILISTAVPDALYVMTKKDYKPVSLRVRFELRDNLTMDYLMRNLSAKDFTDYVRSNDLIMCPLLKK